MNNNKDNANMYFDKISQAIGENNPLKVAIISYQAYRDSPLADSLRHNKERYDNQALRSIAEMKLILTTLEWPDADINKFIDHSLELAEMKIG